MRGSTLFKVENMWLKEIGFEYLLKGWWTGIILEALMASS